MLSTINRWVNTFPIDFFDGVVNFSELSKAYPNYFEINGDNVTFFRLFFFMPSECYSKFFKCTVIGSFGAAGIILSTDPKKAMNDYTHRDIVTSVVCTTACIGLGILVASMIPTKPGIYFY